MERRTFLTTSASALAATALPQWTMNMTNTVYDTIIVGGSFSGLSAALALGRARRSVLVIDANEPCNARVPHSHNLLTHDGEPPAEVREQALADVAKYPTVHWFKGRANEATGAKGNFTVRTLDGAEHRSRTLLLALGLRDEMPDLEGFASCWGISAAACPFCHGYEVADQRLVVLGNATETPEYAKLVHNWSANTTVLTNGTATFTAEQRAAMAARAIHVIEQPIARIDHVDGKVNRIVFADGSNRAVDAMFTRLKTTVPLDFARTFGLQLNDMGLLLVDPMQRTNVAGVYASGDCTSPVRALSMAMATGSMAGAIIVHELVGEQQH